jgi:hypothetical protein
MLDMFKSRPKPKTTEGDAAKDAKDGSDAGPDGKAGR